MYYKVEVYCSNKSQNTSAHCSFVMAYAQTTFMCNQWLSARPTPARPNPSLHLDRCTCCPSRCVCARVEELVLLHLKSVLTLAV